MTLNIVVRWLEKYSFILIILFCFGFFSPNLAPKIAMMDNDATSFAEKISGGNFKKQVFWLSLFCFFAWRAFQERIFTKNKFEMLGTLLFLSGGLALISTIWSDYSLLTIKRGFFQLVFCFSVVSAFFFAKKHESIEVSLFFGGLLIIGLITLSILMGVGFSGGSLAAFTKGKNLLGQNLLVFIALFTLQIKIYGQKSRYSHWMIIVLSVFLILTISKTSILLLVMFFVLSLLTIFVSKIVNNVTFITLSMIFVFIPSLSYYWGDYIHAGLYLEPGAITGRGIIWDTLYYDLYFFSKLSLGYGYGAFFSNGTIPYFFDDDWSFLKHIASAHSGYIDILIQYGLFVSPIIVFLIYKLSSGVKNCWLSAAFIIPILYNLTESTFLRDQSMMWLFTIILFSYVATLNDDYLQIKRTENING